jgi:hypothetical protein
MKAALTCALLLILVAGLRAQTQYFPDRAFCGSHETGTCERWYAKHLRAMGEPSLWELSKDASKQSYRFLWLRTFDHPVSTRLEVAKDGTAQLLVKVLNGKVGMNPGTQFLTATLRYPRKASITS